MKTIVWGAGREGRGFLADIFAPVAEIHFVDADETLVDRLRGAGQYRLLLRPPAGSAGERRLSGYEAWHVRGDGVPNLIATADVLALCIYLEDMPEAVRVIAKGLERRRAVNPDQPLDVFICANSVNYGPRLRALFHAALPKDSHAWFDGTVGIVETLLRRTCVTPDAAAGERDPLAVMINVFPALAFDGGAAKRSYGDLPFLVPVDDMRMEERRKIYTYNLLHVTYAYLGYPKGYALINQSRDDEAIQAVARRVYAESSAALIAEYSLDRAEMEEYERMMWSYVVNPAMPDSVIRTGHDPVRKLGRDERIVGPAMLCSKHGLPFENLALVAAAAFRYDNPEDEASQRLRAEVRERGIRASVEKHCALDPASPFADAVVRAYNA